MGTIMKAQDITVCGNKGLFRPIIYCNPTDELAATTESINISLARQLLKNKANQNSSKAYPLGGADSAEHL